MSESSHPPTVSYASSHVMDAESTSPLLRLAGMIGLAACVLGLVLLLAGCAGAKWFAASPVIILMGSAGLLISLLGALTQRRRISEETHVLLAVFTNVIAIIGGLIEMAVWKGWPLFPA